jgi:cruciform cutting endonuclease 1
LDIVPGPPSREPYDPATYAQRAYTFVQHLLALHKPTHILIERQRFRSGGNAAVQEWTIRVGIFEAMLYSVFNTLRQEGAHNAKLIAMFPVPVNRYWLELIGAPPGRNSELKSTGSALKQRKIGIVQEMVRGDLDTTGLTFYDEANSMRQHFLFPSKQRENSANLGKRDDLADCLLQGLAWVRWQNNRLRLDAMKEDAFQLD